MCHIFGVFSVGRRLCASVVDVLILQRLLYIFYLVVKSALMGLRVSVCEVCYDVDCYVVSGGNFVCISVLLFSSIN